MYTLIFRREGMCFWKSMVGNRPVFPEQEPGAEVSEGWASSPTGARGRGAGGGEGLPRRRAANLRTCTGKRGMFGGENRCLQGWLWPPRILVKVLFLRVWEVVLLAQRGGGRIYGFKRSADSRPGLEDSSREEVVFPAGQVRGDGCFWMERGRTGPV